MRPHPAWSPRPRPAWRPLVGVGADDDSDERPEYNIPVLGGLIRTAEELPRRFVETRADREAREQREDLARAQRLQQQGVAPAEATRQVQQQRTFGLDPERWVQQQAERVRDNPIVGLPLAAAQGVFGPLNFGARYLAGAGLGAVQALDPTSHPAGSPQFGGPLPPVQNPLNPAESLGRFESVAGPVGGLAFDVATGFVNPSGALGRVPGVGRVLGEGSLPGQLAEQATRTAGAIAGDMAPGLAGRAILPLVEDTAPTVARTLAPFAPPAIGSAAGYVRPPGVEGEPTEEQRLTGAVEGAFAGLIASPFISRALWTREGAPRLGAPSGPRPVEPAPGVTFSPELDRVTRDLARANYLARGGSTTVPFEGETLTPSWIGGDARNLADNFRYAMSTRTAHSSTAQTYAETSLGRALPEPLRFEDQQRLLGGLSGVTGHAADYLMAPALSPVRAREVPDFEQWWFLKHAREALDAPVRTTPGGTPVYRSLHRDLPTPADADRVLGEFEANLGHKDPTTVGRFQTAMDAWQRDVNGWALQEAEAGGLISPAQRADMASRYQFYGLLEDADATYDSLAKRESGRGFVAQGRGISRAHPNDLQAALRLETQVSRVGKLVSLARRNRMMQHLDEAVEQAAAHDPQWRNLWRDNPVEFREIGGQPAWVPKSEVPAGYGRVPLLKDGVYTERLAPADWAHELTGYSDEQLGTITKLLARTNVPFRFGVTAGSVPFLFGHAWRTLETMLERAPGQLLPQMLTEAPRAVYELLTEGADTWFARNQHSPWVAGLPQRIKDTVDRAVLGGAGRQLGAMRAAGGGGVSVSEHLLRGADDAVRTLHLARTPAEIAADTARNPGRIIRNAADLMESATAFVDAAPRLMGWRAARRLGVSEQAAALLSREGGVDFAKSGSVGRVMNLLFPLFNPRVQGMSSTLRMAWENPAQFTARMASFVAMPTMAVWAYNQHHWPGLADRLSVDDRQHYWNLIVGHTYDDQGREQPVSLRVVKSPLYQIVANPIEHILDAVYHTKDGAVDHQTGRSTGEMLKTQLGLMIPSEPHADEVLSPWGQVNAALTMLPAVNWAVEMAANRDRFTGRPIIPDDMRQLPGEYQALPRTSKTARAISAVLYPLAPDPRSTPVGIEQATRAFGGTFADFWLHAADSVFPVLERAGLLEPGAFNPTRVEDLKLPPGAPPELAQKYLGGLAHEDQRPWWASFVPRVFGWSGNADQMQERIRHASPEQQRTYAETQAFWKEFQVASATIDAEKAKLFANPGGWSSTRLREQVHTLNVARQVAYDTAQRNHPAAVLDPADVEGFRQSLPGWSSRDFRDTLAQLPPGVTAEALHQRFTQPPGVDPSLRETNVTQWAQAQQRELVRMSQETGLPPSLLKDYIGAVAFDREVPGLPIPVAGYEDAFARYHAPRGADGAVLDPLTTPPDQYAAAQRAVVDTLAAKWGMPAQQVAEQLNTRHLRPGTVTSPLELSLAHAQALNTELHDPQQFPRYADAHGQALGSPEEWGQYDRALDAVRNRYGVRPQAWPAWARRLDQGRRYGEAERYFALTERLGAPGGAAAVADYERWYGAGRDATQREWESFMSGETPRYRGVSDPAQALRNDLTLRLYEHLPPGPERNRLRGAALRLHRAMVPRWRALVDPENVIGATFQAPTMGETDDAQ